LHPSEANWRSKSANGKSSSDVLILWKN
jgi:hypothetical protein